jgi:hypothetical protein
VFQPAPEKIEEALWRPDPSTQSALDNEIRVLMEVGPDGKCELQRYFDAYDIDNQRDHEIEQVVLKRFKSWTDDVILFQSFTRKVVHTGYGLFVCRAAEIYRDLKDARWARNEVNLRLFFDS